MEILDHAALRHAPLVKIADQTSHATAGTRTIHAHGLKSVAGHPVVPEVVIPVPKAADADGAVSAVSIHVVKVDDTNVTIRASASSVSFDLYVG